MFIMLYCTHSHHTLADEKSNWTVHRLRPVLILSVARRILAWSFNSLVNQNCFESLPSEPLQQCKGTTFACCTHSIRRNRGIICFKSRDDKYIPITTVKLHWLTRLNKKTPVFKKKNTYGIYWKFYNSWVLIGSPQKGKTMYYIIACSIDWAMGKSLWGFDWPFGGLTT